MIQELLGGEVLTAFLVIGAVGLAIIVLSLVVGGVLDGLFGLFDVDIGGGVFSAPVIGSFLAAFGFGAALIMFATDGNATIGALGGLASGGVIGAIALVMMRTLMDMPTDETVTTQGLEGTAGIVITPIPADGYGEVTIRHHGEQRKYNARAASALPVGAQVQVTAVLSASAVLVAPSPDPIGPDPASVEDQ